MRKDHKAGVNVASHDQNPEISSVLSHENEILVDATGKHQMVRLTEATEVAWMLHDMEAFRVKARSDAR